VQSEKGFRFRLGMLLAATPTVLATIIWAWPISFGGIGSTLFIVGLALALSQGCAIGSTIELVRCFEWPFTIRDYATIALIPIPYLTIGSVYSRWLSSIWWAAIH